MLIEPAPGQEAGNDAGAESRPSILDLYVPALDGLPVGASTIELGRSLFSDTRLSADGSLACASCHDPDRAFTVHSAGLDRYTPRSDRESRSD